MSAFLDPQLSPALAPADLDMQQPDDADAPLDEHPEPEAILAFAPSLQVEEQPEPEAMLAFAPSLHVAEHEALEAFFAFAPSLQHAELAEALQELPDVKLAFEFALFLHESPQA